MSVSGTFTIGGLFNETLEGAGVAGANQPVVKHTLFNRSAQLNATATVDNPASGSISEALHTLTAGAKTIDLTAAPGSQGNVNGTGLRVVTFQFTNLGENPMTVQGGASNGYLLFGTAGKVIVEPGETIGFVSQGKPVVGGSAKNIDISGTGVETFNLQIVFGTAYVAP